MRKIHVKKIKDTVRELSLSANFNLRKDIENALKKAAKKEKNKNAAHILNVLLENARIARQERRAICQDTGIVSVYARIGSDVKFTGGDFEKAVQNGVKEAYKKGFLRKSVVKSPIARINTFTNTPALLYVELVKGKALEIIVMPKGFGSENKSRIKMLKPTEGKKEIISFILDAVKAAGADACPPYVLGIGLGGTFDKAAALSKRALTYPLNKKNSKTYLRKLEKDILKKVNKLKIGPMGLGGNATCLGLNILESPTHIAGLPVAVNVSCHATRSARGVI